jgi:hypothetical protein
MYEMLNCLQGGGPRAHVCNASESHRRISNFSEVWRKFLGSGSTEAGKEEAFGEVGLLARQRRANDLFSGRLRSDKTNACNFSSHELH